MFMLKVSMAFDKYVMSCIHHYNIIQKYPKNTLCFTYSTSPLPELLTITNLFNVYSFAVSRMT